MATDADVEVLGESAELEFPYQHSTGPVIGRFLTEMRDNRRLYGMRCSACAIVQVPPQDYCERCGGALDGWHPVGPDGVLTTFAVVHRAHEGHPLPIPFAYALIRLDGADSEMLHVLRAADYGALRAGLRVRPVWRDERAGAIVDIDHFAPLAPGEE
jgi:hypothetical protein